MAFHVPFEQRRANRRSELPLAQPVYIGFDVPAPPRRKFNWWGFHGMWMSFISLLTAGFLSPVPLLISLIGLRRPGKIMATLGTLTSLAGVAIATTIVLAGVTAHKHHAENQRQKIVGKQVVETQALIETATKELTEYRESHKGHLPQAIDANMLVIKHVDPWGESLRFEPEVGHGIVRSAGPDRKFDTQDDVSQKIEGKTERERLLPVDN